MPVVVGIRPEHIHLSDEGVKAKVDVSEMMGSEIYLHAVARNVDIVIRIPLINLPEEYKASIPYQTELSLNFPGTLVHLFDKDTHENLI